MQQKYQIQQIVRKQQGHVAPAIFLLFMLLTLSSVIPVQAAKKVSLSTKNIVLVKGQKKTIKVKDTKQRPTWSSKNKTIATVKRKGGYSASITAKKKGSTYIYANVNEKKYKCKVKVETPVLDTPTIDLMIGESAGIKLSGTKQKINYKSNDNTIASVDQTGAVTAIAAGNTTITLTLACGKKYTCSVTVTAEDEYALGQVHTGDGTYYDGGYVGGCANLDDIAGSYYVAAINKIDYRAGNLAGAYLKVTGPSGKSVNVLITDTLAEGEGKKGDIDLNIKAFEQIEPLATGRMTVTWEIIPLPTDQPIQYVYKPTSTQYWMQVQVRNHRYPIKKLEIMDASGQYKELPREEYNFFTLNNPGAGPYTFRVTDIYGHVLIDENVPLSPTSAVNGAANFPY